MSAVRATALRAGGACVRCRKGKTKCVYDNGRAPCKNCAKGMHDCYLPADAMSRGGHGVSPARTVHRVRESLPSERSTGAASHADRHAHAGHGQSHQSTAVRSRTSAPVNEKYVTIPCLFHAPSPSQVYAPPVCCLLVLPPSHQGASPRRHCWRRVPVVCSLHLQRTTCYLVVTGPLPRLLFVWQSCIAFQC